MVALSTNAMLMIVGLAVGFGCFFGFMHRKDKAGHTMLHAKDKRLFPHNYQALSNAERKQLYKTHTWQAALDPVGRALAVFCLIGIGIFGYALLASIVETATRSQ